MPQIPQIISQGPMYERFMRGEAPQVSLRSSEAQATEQLGETASGIGEKELSIAQTQQHTQDALQLQKGVNAGLQMHQTAFNSIQGLSADQMLPAYKAAVDTTPILSDPQYSRVKQELDLHLQTLNMKEQGEVAKHAMIAKHSEQQGQLDVQSDHASQLAVNATDALSYNTAKAGGHAAIDLAQSQGAITAAQAAEKHLKFEQNIQLGHALKLAQDPTTAAEMLKGGPNAVPGDALTPEHRQQAVNMAAATIDAPIKAANLADAMVKLNHKQQLDQMAADGDPHLAGAALAAHESGWLSDEGYEHYMHHRPPPDPREKAQDDPAMVNYLKEKIQKDPFSVDHTDLLASATVGAPAVTPRTSMQLKAMLTDARAKLKGPIGDAYTLNRDNIQNTIAPAGPVPINADDRRALTQALGAYDRQFHNGEFHSVEDANKFHDAILKHYKFDPDSVAKAKAEAAAAAAKLAAIPAVAPPSFWARAFAHFASKSNAGAATYGPDDEGGE